MSKKITRFAIDNGGHYLSLDGNDYPAGYVIVDYLKNKKYPWIRSTVGRYRTLQEAEKALQKLNEKFSYKNKRKE